MEITEREYFMIWRKRHNVLLREVSKYCGCSIQTLSNYERGQRNLGDEYLNRYKEFINNYKN